MIRQITAERAVCQALTVDLLQATLTNVTIETVLTAHGVQAARERKCTMTAVVWIVIAMNLYATSAISAVMRTCPGSGQSASLCCRRAPAARSLAAGEKSAPRDQ